MAFEDYVYPITSQEFISRYLGREMRLSKARPDATSMVSLEDIEAVLGRLVVFPGMIRIVLNGRIAPSDRYLRRSDIPGVSARRINVSSLEAILDEGGTLILDHAESLFPEIHTGCLSLWEGLGARVRAIMFIAGSTGAMTELHADEHDIFVYQCFGQKRWTVRAPSTHCDKERSGHAETNGDTIQPVLLQPNDVLYLPRAWPHEPVAVCCPCIHVTFEVLRPTGADVVEFLRGRVTQHPMFLRELPIARSVSARKEHYSRLREAFMQNLSDDVLEAYCASHRLHDPVRSMRLGRSGEANASSPLL